MDKRRTEELAVKRVSCGQKEGKKEGAEEEKAAREGEREA